MIPVINDIDRLLQAAPRTANLPTAQILLTPSAPAFHVDAAGVITPATITFTATRIDIDAPLTFNCATGPLTNVTATTATLAGADMVGGSATVIASAIVNGEVYTGPCTISKFSDGRNADPSDPADLSPEALKAILEGQLTEDQLYQSLQNRISLLDGGADMAGSVTARVKAETDARIAAISQQTQDNRTYVQQYTFSQQTINDAFSAFGSNIQASYQGYADNAANGALAAAKAFAQSYSYSTAQSDSALTATANQLRAEFQTLNQGAGATVAWVQEYTYSRAQANDAIADATRQLSTTVAGHTSTLEIQGQSISGLGAQYSVKIDNNGWVAGYGIASTPVNGVPQSSFIVLADRFAVALPGQAPKFPFVIGTVDGQTVIGLRGDVVLDGTLNIRTAAGYSGDMDATKGATWGANISGQPQDVSNLVRKSYFNDGQVGGWGSPPRSGGEAAISGANSAAVPATSQLVTNIRDCLESGSAFPVTPGEKLYVSGWLCTQDTALVGRIGALIFNKAGVLLQGISASLGPQQAWAYVEGDGVIAAGASYGIPWVQQEGFDSNNDFVGKNFLRAVAMWVGRHARGATVGAPAGTMVGGTDAGLVASRALNGDSAYNALPGITQQIDAKLSRTKASDLAATVTLATGGALLAGTPDNGVYMAPGGIYCVQGGVVKVFIPISGDPTFAGKLIAAFGTFGAVSIAAGGFMQVGDRTWDGGTGLWFGFHNGVSKFAVGAAGGAEIKWDGAKLIVNNPTLATFNLGITNSQNQYNYSLYRGSTDAYAGLYTVAVSTGNDGASFNWTVSGPWPCWLVQDSNSSRMQLHINMKGGAALAGDAGDFYINCSATKGGNTVNTQQLVTVTAS